MPPIPMISCAAEHMYYGLQNHPSYQGTHALLEQLMSFSTLPPCTIHEVDGAYSNMRLNAFFLSQPKFDGTQAKGMFLDHLRCQNHATHLITVSTLGLVGCNMLSKLYQLTSFLSNLGYLLRLQTALIDWLEAELDFQPCSNLDMLEADPLMEEISKYVEFWHRKQGAKDTVQNTAFQKKLLAFKGMFNGKAVGRPQHLCNCNVALSSNACCKSRSHAVQKASKVLIDLLLSTCPAAPTPNKWTKLWRPVDFVVVGLLLNEYLPALFNAAFKALEFKEMVPNSQLEQLDPRVVEGLHFHAVQGKRFLGSQEFLMSPDCRFAIRLLLVAVEPLRYLTNVWLSHLDSVKDGRGYPLHTLLDPCKSPVIAALQWISHLLLSTHGGGRLLFLWRPCCDSFKSWCEHYPEQVGQIRHVLMSVSGWIYRRHFVYWHQFPWMLSVLSNPEAPSDFVESVMQQWDNANACCLRPGLARDLKKLGFTSAAFRSDKKLICTYDFSYRDRLVKILWCFWGWRD